MLGEKNIQQSKLMVWSTEHYELARKDWKIKYKKTLEILFYFIYLFNIKFLKKLKKPSGTTVSLEVLKGQVERHIMLECWYPDWYNISNTTKF
jgi:hypothetical protein